MGVHTKIATIESGLAWSNFGFLYLLKIRVKAQTNKNLSSICNLKNSLILQYNIHVYLLVALWLSVSLVSDLAFC